MLQLWNTTTTFKMACCLFFGTELTNNQLQIQLACIITMWRHTMLVSCVELSGWKWTSSYPIASSDCIANWIFLHPEVAGHYAQSQFKVQLLEACKRSSFTTVTGLLVYYKENKLLKALSDQARIFKDKVFCYTIAAFNLSATLVQKVREEFL